MNEVMQKVAGDGVALAMMFAVLLVFLLFVVFPALMVLLWLVSLFV